MKLLVSSRYGVSFVDTETEEVTNALKAKLAENLLPYGLTWNDENVFVAVRSQPPGTGEFVDIYDHDFNWLSTLDLGPDFFSDLHQICWYDNKLFIMSSGLNKVVILGDKQAVDVWNPNPEAPKKKAESAHGKYDWNHFNSIWFEPGNVYLVAHNFDRPAEIWKFSYPEKLLEEKKEIGGDAHNLCRIKGELFSLKNVKKEAKEEADLPFDKFGYGRGLAVGDKIYAGISAQIKDREKRRETKRGKIGVYNKNFELEKFIDVNKGEIFEVRIWDGPDKAHMK